MARVGRGERTDTEFVPHVRERGEGGLGGNVPRVPSRTALVLVVVVNGN